MKRLALAIALVCAIAAPATAASRPPENDLEHNTRRQQEFAAYNPRYPELKADRVATLKSLVTRIRDREAARQSTQCSQQMLWELKLMVTFTADFAVIDRKIADLRGNLDHPEQEARAAKQAEDGSWGACFDSPILKMMASMDHGFETGDRPFLFLGAYNSPEKLTAHLTSLFTSDIAKTGIDHTFDFNESISDLVRFILRDKPEGYPWDPRLKQTITDLLFHQFRNPETGWWGLRYIRDGQPNFVDDLSVTFHVVSFLHGEVPDLPKIVDTALALKNVDTPAGWLWQGGYWNHNNMDVAMIFRYAWPAASPAQRAAMRVEMDKMLHWTLTESLLPDGSFKPLVPDASLEESNYFGATFLARSGYFDRARRFWTDADFPEAEPIRQRILRYVNAHLNSGGAGGSYYRGVLEELQ
jgi:hypothetical protein